MLGWTSLTVLSCSDDDGPSSSVSGINGSPGGGAQPGGGGFAAGTAAGAGGTGTAATAGGTATIGGAATPGGTGTIGAGGPGGTPGACSTKVVDAYGLVPDMLIVQDRSLSMSMGQRWEPSKQAVKTITTEFEGLVSFGLEYFPGGDGGLGNIGGIGGAVGGLLGGLLGGGATMGAGGTTGAPVATCGGMEKLDVPLMLRNAAPIGMSLDTTMPNGFTPTGPALDLALKILGDRNQGLDAVVKPAYVLLVTDGDPRCGVTEDPGQQEAARAAVRALKAANIPTYVFGFQIDPNYANLMNELATLGGSMKYYPVESGDQIIAAFRDITKDVIKCTFNLDQVPENVKKVRVTIDGKTIALDETDGWVINGKTVTLQGGSCSMLKDGRGHTLSAQIECTEIVLN